MEVVLAISLQLTEKDKISGRISLGLESKK
jgi:hypothetical protein